MANSTDANIRAHAPGCRARTAIASAVSFECEHGLEVCPECDPCTCGAPGIETLAGYEEEVGRTYGHPRDGEPGFAEVKKLCHALGLAGEAGEVADYIKKAHLHGHALDLVKLANELGDVLWYVAALARGHGMTLADCANANAAKLRARYPAGFDPERSRAREASRG